MMFRKLAGAVMLIACLIAGKVLISTIQGRGELLAVQAATCPTNTFLDVSKSEGAGPNYPRPSLSVNCTDGFLVVTSNGIPHYTFQSTTPNPLLAQSIVYQVALSPQYSEKTTPIAILGEIGLAVNGMPIFGPNEAINPRGGGYGDPVFNRILDRCKGHTAYVYHYHAFVQSCFYPQQAEGKPSPILGYAFDGYPIYGPYGCLDVACTQVIKFRSSYQQIGSPANNVWDAFKYVKKAGGEYLDECNGRTQPDGTYGYHATDTFPYLLGCYHGVVNAFLNGRDYSNPVGWEQFKTGGFRIGGPGNNNRPHH